jgi:transcriptional regulator with XRE-family HTH domain
MAGVDDIRIGRLLRALRRSRGLRQSDLAAAAGVSQSLISLIERGHVSQLSIAVVRRIFAVVDARFEGSVSWRGGAIDRVLDERHARLVGAYATELERLGWEVHLEVTFNEYGDRGSIDILGLNRNAGAALVVEIKTELTAIDETIRRLDVKARLASTIVSRRVDWKPASVSPLLVVLESATNRRRVAAHHGSLGFAFPDRGVVARRWLRAPTGRVAALQFFSLTNRRGTGPRGAAEAAPRGTKRPSVATGVHE